MRMRLIGIGELGQEMVLGICHYFAEQGLNRFLERRLVVKVTTEDFSRTYTQAKAQLTTHAPQVATENSVVMLQWSLAQLFFGGKDAEMSSRWNAIVLGNGLNHSPEEHATAHRFFQRLRRSLTQMTKDKPVTEQFFAQIRSGFTAHCDRVATPVLPDGTRVNNIGPDWLIVPTMPMTVDLKSQFSLTGQQLATAIPETDFRRGRLIQGLGVAESEVDVVAIVYSLNDTFAAEGARLICEHVRRALLPQEANRIVAVLGFGVYDTPDAAYPAGRYIAEQIRLTRGDSAFDGMITCKNDVTLRSVFPKALAAMAVSSTPDTVQIDNPDANQIQRDFGRGMIGFGYAEADAAGDLYTNAKNDWIARHAESLDEGSRDSLRIVFGKQVELLTKANLVPPKWAKSLTAKEAGAIEMATARKVVVYVGHDDRLKADDLQQIREQVETDFPRARTVVYKYELLPPIPAPRRNQTTLGRIADGVGKLVIAALGRIADGVGKLVIAARGTSKTTRSDKPDPRPIHLAMFVVDCFETRAINCFADFLKWSIGVTDPSSMAPIIAGQDDTATTIKQTLLARALLDDPNAQQSWPRVHSADTVKALGLTDKEVSMPYIATLLDDSINGGVDKDTLKRAASSTQQWLLGEVRPPAAALTDEAQDIANTVGRAEPYLIDSLPASLVSPDWLAEVLAGLHMICNEHVERRKVPLLVADLALQARKLRAQVIISKVVVASKPQPG